MHPAEAGTVQATVPVKVTKPARNALETTMPSFVLLQMSAYVLCSSLAAPPVTSDPDVTVAHPEDTDGRPVSRRSRGAVGHYERLCERAKQTISMDGRPHSALSPIMLMLAAADLAHVGQRNRL
jgi:hypothetical protein